MTDHGLRLSVWEWGDEAAPPLLLAHGGFDFAGTYDGFAPLLADGGWRVVCWDQRGHGDSDHSVLYSWDADVRDALAVLDSITRRPIPFVGHSKGAGVVMQLADALRVVVSQRLIPRAGGEGRVAALEVLRGSYAVAAAIREGKTSTLQSAMQAGKKEGMIALERCLADLVQKRQITQEAARAVANDPATLTQYLAG